MQRLFSERTDWHVPWMERALPQVRRIARAQPSRTIFTRFVPPLRAEQARGSWRRYYGRWSQMTRERLDEGLIELVPPLAELVPPARVSTALGQGVEGARHQYARDTDICILATVMAAVDAGYRVVLATDAVCSVSDEMHDALLKLYRERFNEQIETASTHEIVASWL